MAITRFTTNRTAVRCRLVPGYLGAVILGLIVFFSAVANAGQGEQRWPAMWKVSDDDSQIYLFGTFHALPASMQWQSDYFLSVMESTTTTFFEADTSSSEALVALQLGMQEYGLNAPGVTLSALLGEERTKAFADVAEEVAGIPMAQLEPMRPWLAMVTVSMATFHKLGLNPASGADMLIEQQARREGDEIAYLESGMSQIRAMASLDEQGDFAMIDETVEQMNNFEEEVKTMLNAWAEGDEDLLYEKIVDGLKDVSQLAYEALFVNRNANWVRQIESMMEADGDYLIAVGAGHLVGDESVVDMLQAKGFTVDRVQ